ncbi:MAG: FKBP-type peptidyl-prolyl cis-trans isomerase [Burkholderiaceae bacterium]
MTSDRSYVAPDSFLTLHYRLSGPGGDIINTFGDKPATLSLGTGELSPAVEQCLVGMEEGARAVFELPAGVAFGERQADRVQWVARSLLDQLGEHAEVYQVGDVVQFPTPDGLGSYSGAVLRVGAGAMAVSASPAGVVTSIATTESPSAVAAGAAAAASLAPDAAAASKRGNAVQFDFNHPLAGRPVTFEVHLIGVL